MRTRERAGICEERCQSVVAFGSMLLMFRVGRRPCLPRGILTQTCSDSMASLLMMKREVLYCAASFTR